MRNDLLSWRQRGMLWVRLTIRFILTALILWLLQRFGSELLSIFAPFVAAFIVTILLDPAVKWIQRRSGWSRQTASLLLILVLLAVVGSALCYLLYAAGREVVDLVQNWDKLLRAVQLALEQMEDMLFRLFSLLPPELIDMLEQGTEALLQWLSEAVPNALSSIAQVTGETFKEIPSFVVAFFISIMAIYFLLSDYPYLRTKAIQHLDENLLHFFRQVRVTALGAFGGYIKAQLILSAGVFFILLAGFTVTQQSYGLLLALGLAVLDFIPLIGAGTVMVPWAVIALLTRDYTTAISIMVIWGIIVVFRRVAEPKIVGDQTGLSPILSLISIYVGMKVAGVAGMILGPILVLVVINLSGMGMFRSLQQDIQMAVRDVISILSQETKDA